MIQRRNFRKKSFCWKFFKRFETYGECQLCGKKIRTFSNTTNLLHHLRRMHTGLYLTTIEERDENYTYSPKDLQRIEAEREPPDFTEDGSHQNGDEANVAVHTLQAYTCEDGRTVLWLKPASEGDQEIEIQNGHIEPVIAEEGETIVPNGETHDAPEKETSEQHESEAHQVHQSDSKPQEVAPSPKKYISSSFMRTVQGSSYSNKSMLRKVVRPSPLARPSSDTNSSNRDDTFDHFGKYIASLLRSLPSRKVACRLQGEMINWVMKEQMKLSDS